MNKEELIGKLQMVYVGDRNALNEMIDYYDELFDEMSDWREEAKELKKQFEEKNKPQIFIETQDMEERYAEGLYQDYLEEENKKYKEVIDKAREELKKGLHELDIRRREEVYIEQYIEEALNMLKEVE